MSRFLLDTNAVIALLRGNLQLNAVIANAEWVGISIITKLEFLYLFQAQAYNVALTSPTPQGVAMVRPQ